MFRCAGSELEAPESSQSDERNEERARLGSGAYARPRFHEFLRVSDGLDCDRSPEWNEERVVGVMSRFLKALEAL